MDIKKLVNRYIGVSGGYLGDFSYRTHADFYPEYCDLDIDPYKFDGTTRERFETILETSPPHVQAKIIRGILEKYPPKADEAHRTTLYHSFVELANALESTEGVVVALTTVTSDVVERAINDAETLIRSRGATSGVDRLHTALHGYLRAVCDDAQVAYDGSATMVALFKRIQSDHPAFSAVGHRAQDVSQIMRAMSSIMDALNPLRNNASVAHPNEVLLDEPEAMLAINSARTILHYLDSKIVRYRSDLAQQNSKAAADAEDDIPF